jgi:hypothetical protein
MQQKLPVCVLQAAALFLIVNTFGCLEQYISTFLLFFSVNKQLNDKERVAAALENSNLLDIVEECLSPTLG